jgi:signal transduction histidine kinase
MLRGWVALAEGLHDYDARMARLPDSEQLMAVVRDITEQKKLETERERLNRFIVLLFRLASNFINLPLGRMDAEIDQALGEMGEFVGADRAYVFSYQFDRHVGSNTHEWCAPGITPEKEHLQDLTLDLIPDWVRTHLRGDILHVPDVQALPAGALREILEPQGIRSLITLPLTSQNGCLGFVGFDSVREPHAYDEDELGLLRLFAQMLVNVYERHTAENRLHQLTAELEERVRDRTRRLDASVRGLSRANAELEAFTYSVSHDLKSPLRSLEGFCTLLLEDHAQQLDAEGMDYLGRIQRAARHMAQLINDMLAYSRLENQEQSLRGLQLAGLVENVLRGMGNELDLRAATVRLSVAEDLQVRAAPEGLAMVLRNLIDNALKFSRPEQPPAIDITACAQGDTVRLTVQDNGQGFDMKYHDRIFALFQRLHRADQVPGTGLGLAMVHKAIERMEGRIWAESAPGQGSAFHIELPRA